MTDRITFARFDAVLEDLGFRQTVIPGSHSYYEHPGTGAFLLTRLHKPKDIVPSYVLLAARRDLENQGVIAASDFDAMLQAAAA